MSTEKSVWLIYEDGGVPYPDDLLSAALTEDDARWSAEDWFRKDHPMDDYSTKNQTNRWERGKWFGPEAGEVTRRVWDSNCLKWKDSNRFPGMSVLVAWRNRAGGHDYYGNPGDRESGWEQTSIYIQRIAVSQRPEAPGSSARAPGVP